MFSLTIMQNMTADELIRHLENYANLDEVAQLLLTRLKEANEQLEVNEAEIVVNSEFALQAVDHARSLVKFYDDLTKELSNNLVSKR